MSDVTITYLTGTKKLEPVEYRLTKRIRTKKFLFIWWNVVEYCIETNYMTLAPFKTKNDALETAAYGGIVLKDETW